MKGNMREMSEASAGGRAKGRILGIDFGEKRVGVAVSDGLLLTAQGVGIIENRGPRKLPEEVAAIAERYGAGVIVVGLPKNMDGSLGRKAEEAERFAERLREACGLEVVMWDERLSTVRAERGMLEGDLSRAKRRRLRDKVAAQLILQGYLDRLRVEKRGSEDERAAAEGAVEEEGRIEMEVKSKIELRQGDITEMAADAIVNAANNDLVLGGGVAGAIRRKGGPSIQAECDGIGPIEVGGAAITGGGELKAGYVIHAASMRLGGRTTAESLRSSTRKSLMLADEKGLKTIAFPAIGTGVAGFAVDECARIMIDAVMEHLEGESSLEKVYFVLFDEGAFGAFKEYLEGV